MLRNMNINGMNMPLAVIVKSSSGDRFVKSGITPGGGSLEGIFEKSIPGGRPVMVNRELCSLVKDKRWPRNQLCEHLSG